jgi:hypothetical protein
MGCRSEGETLSSVELLEEEEEEGGGGGGGGGEEETRSTFPLLFLQRSCLLAVRCDTVGSYFLRPDICVWA